MQRKLVVVTSILEVSESRLQSFYGRIFLATSTLFLVSLLTSVCVCLGYKLATRFSATALLEETWVGPLPDRTFSALKKSDKVAFFSVLFFCLAQKERQWIRVQYRTQSCLGPCLSLLSKCVFMVPKLFLFVPCLRFFFWLYLSLDIELKAQR